MNHKLILFFIITIFSVELYAQKPDWTDYYERQEMYPESEYLVGFISGFNKNEEESGDLKLKYEMLAKDKLVQSIQVAIETNNSLDISNINGNSNEAFLSKSVSFSKANVNGLKAYSYYDRKKKEVFAIAFANIKELTFYYRNLISSGKTEIKQKLSEGKKYAEKGNKEDALRSFYEAMPILKNIDEARVLLIALNRKMYSDIDIDEINKLKVDLINQIDKLIKPEELSLSETAYFAAYGLFLQLGINSQQFYMSDMSFENTGLKSKFSEKWNHEFSAALVKAGKYNVSDRKSYNQLVVNGNYWKEGKFLKLNISVWDADKIVAVSKASILILKLEKENIDYIPLQIKKMKSLATFTLHLVNAPEVIKVGTPSLSPMIINVSSNTEGLSKPIQNFPVMVTAVESDVDLCKAKTNENGMAECFLPPIETSKKNIAVQVSLDIESYFNVEKNSLYYGIAKIQNPLKPIIENIEVAKPTIYVESYEKLYGKTIDIKTLEPAVKGVFAEKSYNFVDNKDLADMIVKINANTTTATAYQGIRFAYLDINISIIETSSGEELIKTHFDQIKGGGANQLKAAKKAYMLGAEKVKEYINSNF